MLSKSNPSLENNNKHHGHSKQHFSDTEVVHIERNILEDFIISLKKWVHHNKTIVKILISVVIISIIITIIVAIIHNSLSKKHNALFFKSFDSYTEYKKITDTTSQKEKLLSISKELGKLCDSLIKTKYSENGCLLQAIIHIHLNQNDMILKPLAHYTKYHNNESISALLLFDLARVYENLGQLDKAYETYNEMNEILLPIKKNELALYGRARVLYAQGKFDLALTQFKKLLVEFPLTSNKEKVDRFIRLIYIVKQATKQK